MPQNWGWEEAGREFITAHLYQIYCKYCVRSLTALSEGYQGDYVTCQNLHMPKSLSFPTQKLGFMCPGFMCPLSSKCRPLLVSHVWWATWWKTQICCSLSWSVLGPQINILYSSTKTHITGTCMQLSIYCLHLWEGNDFSNQKNALLWNQTKECIILKVWTFLN